MRCFKFEFISLSIDPLQGQRPRGYRNSDINSKNRILPCILSFGSMLLAPRLSLKVTLY
jgi:hypothetical protein